MKCYVTAATSFDGPATTDAALAALAAEAGLIDPEPSKETAGNKEMSVVEQGVMVIQADRTSEGSGETDGVPSTETTSVGLFGGNPLYQKIGLKGGSKLRLGLFGGSPVGLPGQKLPCRIGLYGGSKDPPNGSGSQDSGFSSQESTNGNITIKTERIDEHEEYNVQFGDNASKDSSATLNVSIKPDPDAADTDAMPVVNEKKPETGDALSALASAALHHSKDFKTETKDIKSDKDIWYTVGFIKGTSFDVQSYFLCEDDDSCFTVDNLPDFSHLPRINLEPGTAYKFRVAAINSVGRGEWSEVK